MGEKIVNWLQENLGPNEKIDIDDEKGDPLLTIRRFKKGPIHITLKFEGKAYTYGLEGTKKIYIYPKKGD